MYASNANIINNNDINRVAFRFLAWSFGILGILYVLFLGNMVMNIVQRRTLEVAAHNLSNEVGDLELTYLSLSNNVDLALSSSLGFKEAKPTFATRKSLGFNNTKLVQNDL